MSLLVPAVAASALWYYAAKGYDLKEKANVPLENASQDPAVKEAFQGSWLPIKDYWLATTRGRFVSVEETYDVNGAKIFLVDYGNGARTVQYLDPRIEV